MKRIRCKVLSVLLFVVMAIGIFPFASAIYDKERTDVKVSAVSYTTPPTIGKSTVLDRIEELQDILEGKYFTSDGKVCNSSQADRCYNATIIAGSWFQKLFTEKKPSSYKQFPVHYTSTGSVTQNAYSCAGFGNFAMWYIFSSKSTDAVTTTKVKTISSSKANFQEYAMPGDILRVDSTHTAIFISAGASGVEVLDSNWSSTPDNKVRTHTISYSTYSKWTISRADNYNISENTLTVNYHINGGTALPTYKLTEATNLRNGATTLGTTVYFTIPQGEVITVTETKEADGYTWGKTTYDGQSGWCVLEYATRRYYSESEIMYKHSTSAQATTVWAQGTGGENGLYNAVTFGLIKAGYKFAGWCKDANGDSTIFDQDDTSLVAEDIEPTVTEGNKSITLYAVWKPDCTQGNHEGANGTWESDGNSHTYTCSCGTVVITNEAHIFGDDDICNSCGYEKSMEDNAGNNSENDSGEDTENSSHTESAEQPSDGEGSVQGSVGADVETDGGCSSVIGGGAAALFATIGCGIMMFIKRKKKE